MKRQILAFLMVLLAGKGLLAQTETAGARILLPPGTARPMPHAPQTKSTACGVDTIVYPYLKELTFAAPADSFFVDAMVGNVRTAAQAYHIGEPVTIHGVQFWGGAYSTSTAPQTLAVRLYLYAVDALNMPTVKLDSADVTVTNTYDFYEATFATPHVYGQNFAVAARCILNDTLAVISNNAGNAWSPNYGEGLAWRRFGSGAWNSAQSFFGQDLEYMIFPIVSYDIAASFTTDGPSECTGTEAEFTNTSSSILSNRMLNLNAFNDYWGFSAADSTYTWEYGETGATENSVQGAYTYATNGSYEVELTAELAGYYTSCSDTYTAMIDVLETPEASLNVSGTVAFCDSGFVSLVATPATDVNYQWYMDSTALSDSTAATLIVSESGDYFVVVDNACGTDTSAAVTAELSTVPVATLNTGATIDVCTGEPAQLIATPVSGADYQWLVDGTPVADSIFASYTTAEAGDYAVIVSNTCGSDTSAVTALVVHEEPEASLNVSGALTFCEGSFVTLSASPVTDVSYTWLMNGGAIADSTDGTLTVDASGDYTVIASNSCGVDTAVFVTVEVNSLPAQPEIIEAGGVLYVDSSTVMPGFLFQWQTGGTDIPGGTTDTLVPAANGDYTLVVTDANGCTNTSEAFNVDFIGMDELSALHFTVAPNPSNNLFTVTYDGLQELRFALYDAHGKLVNQEALVQQGQQTTAVFNVAELSEGLYLLRATGNGATLTKRIVVKH